MTNIPIIKNCSFPKKVLARVAEIDAKKEQVFDLAQKKIMEVQMRGNNSINNNEPKSLNDIVTLGDLIVFKCQHESEREMAKTVYEIDLSEDLDTLVY
jgi:hypothetical protein